MAEIPCRRIAKEACVCTSTKTRHSVVPKRIHQDKRDSEKVVVLLYRCCSSTKPGATSPFGIEVMNVT